MVVMVGSFGLNIVLDAIFISWLGWGVAGAGWATLIGQLAAAAAYFHYFANGVSQLRLQFSWRHAIPAAREIIALGLPATATTLLSTLSLVLLLKAAASSGEEAVAALAVALRVLSFGMLPILGLCSGAEAVFGFAYGAGNRERLSQSLRIVLGVAAAYGLAWSGAAILFARPLLAPFAPDASTLDLAVRASNAFEAVFVLSAIAYVVLTLFQAIGASRRAALLSLASQGYAILPLLAVLPQLWGFDGVLAARSLAEAAAFAIAVALLLAHRDGK
jgi:Na+-driven multidrug efflux pump